MNASQNTVYRHAGTAVDFLINGAMRKLENEVADHEPTDKLLAGLVARIHAECDDWAESILDIKQNEISVGLNCARNPYNITLAIIDLLVELNGLEGLAKDSPSMRRIEDTIAMIRARNAQDETTFSATSDFKLVAQPCPPDMECPLCAAGIPVRHAVAEVQRPNKVTIANFNTDHVPAPHGVIAVFEMPSATPESEAIAIADSCGLQVLKFDADGKLTVVGTKANVDVLTSNLAYGPASVRPVA